MMNKALAKIVELLERLVVNGDAPAVAGIVGELHLQSHGLREIGFERAGIGILLAPPAAASTLGGRLALARQRLDPPHAQPLFDDTPGESRGIVRPDQRTGMAHAQPAVIDHCLHGLRQAQKAQEIGNMAA